MELGKEFFLLPVIFCGLPSLIFLGVWIALAAWINKVRDKEG